MKKSSYLKLVILFSILSFSAIISAQNRLVEVVCEKDPNTTGYIFMCKNNSVFNYIVEIEMTSMTNLSADAALPYKATVNPGTNRLFSLKPIAQGVAVDISFKYYFYKGCAKTKPDTEYPYVLPLSPAKSAQVIELSFMGDHLGQEKAPKDWYALGFTTTEGDTIFASRKGVVGEVVSNQKEEKGTNLSFSKNANYIEVQHEDCTFARYELFKENGALVKVGDKIQAGQPIGVIGAKNYASGSHVRMSVFYGTIETVKKDNKEAGKQYSSAYVPIQFWIEGKMQKLEKDKTYKSEHPEIVITKEMSKKEKKKWSESKSSN